MHLMYVDESGSHGASHGNRAYVLAGLVLDGPGAARLSRTLDDLVRGGVGRDVDDDRFELHAAELRRPAKDPGSPWIGVDGGVRRRVLEAAVRAVGEAAVTVLVETADPGARDREPASYGRLLARFDAWLGERSSFGLVLSDVSRHDGTVRARFEDVRERGGELGRIVDVPMFCTTEHSRLLQAADLCAWSMWRELGNSVPDPSWVERLGPAKVARAG